MEEGDSLRSGVALAIDEFKHAFGLSNSFPSILFSPFDLLLSSLVD